ncbi:amino acid aminotransferase [Yoonia sediminilitoris]|uniref:Aromatic amino acid aminotransferase n=1 Tax=Yoonia sediminilitoris TaxID=1286148 RepID=A0A2T6KI94_9RHOB|nr:amino acid aminotransferase [Yoonia sediminilitoris]PUB15428.1 aromatic amino acid aminotransferase [Yoonia sediminilitoris]RCW96038.1 aromatic amino acid aminotransferase [Yoonia sediminilitoris]
MLENLIAQPADKILALMAAFKADPRDTKVDLGVGVYKDATGNTPVMRAVKEAERRIVADQTTKAYTGLAGDPAFGAAMRDLVLGDSVAAERVAAVATPGGTGAIRQALELIKMASPDATVWLSNPTWPNHPSIIRYLGMNMAEYRYFDSATRGVDFAGLIEDLGQIKSGDVVLIHGCCHNPTGANLRAEQIAEIITLMQTKGAIPFIDIAYQGFGDGLQEDAQITRQIASAFDNCLIAASCSKNFGIYRERTGILMGIAKDADQQKLTQQTLQFLNRQNYSFPPDHGARVVTTILNDPALRKDWEAELEETRNGMLVLRQQLADELRRLTNSDRFDFLAHHRGMFSLLGTSPDKVEKLRADHGIYMVGDSRMNIAGLNADTVPILAKAIVAAGI